MPRLTLKERFFDPRPPSRRPRRAAYALPTLFTAGNIFLGFIAIVRAVEGTLLAATGQLGPNPHFEVAAKAIGAAVVLDGLDGRIARMTNTVSDFGREMDSLADVITFGIAPAVLAYTWGVQFVHLPSQLLDERAGYFLSFLFLLCGAARLARFNITTNPVPKNPGRKDRKYFVGLPIPAGAAMIASIVYFANGSEPLQWWVQSALWLALLGLLSFLMVCTWRYPSFKHVNLSGPRSPLLLVLFGVLIYLGWNFPQPVLLLITVAYVGSGIAIRAGGIVRRIFRRREPQPERQLG
jgi:CDP-diacylglycerol---serine O-phosphatidyltransferase